MMKKYINLRYIFFNISVVLVLTFSTKTFSYELNTATSYDFSSFSSFEENKSTIIKNAKNDACFNAFRNYIATFDQDQLKNYKRIKSKIESNLKTYMVCGQIIDESIDFSNSTYSIVVTVNIDSNND